MYVLYGQNFRPHFKNGMENTETEYRKYSKESFVPGSGKVLIIIVLLKIDKYHKQLYKYETPESLCLSACFL